MFTPDADPSDIYGRQSRMIRLLRLLIIPTRSSVGVFSCSGGLRAPGRNFDSPYQTWLSRPKPMAKPNTCAVTPRLQCHQVFPPISHITARRSFISRGTSLPSGNSTVNSIFNSDCVFIPPLAFCRFTAVASAPRALKLNTRLWYVSFVVSEGV